MQQPVRSIPHNRQSFSRLTRTGVVLLVAAALGPLGCGGTVRPGEAPKPFAGQSLTLSCPNAALAKAITPAVKAWEARTGATVTMHREPMTPTDATDLGIVPAGDLGTWAESGHLAPVPAKLRADPAFQWSGLLPAYGERLVEWGGQTVAVPITGDGFLLVYRTDRFAEKAATEAFVPKRAGPISAPVSWEEFAQIAELFAKLDKKPSLPPLPADPERLFNLVSRVASSADRAALNDHQMASRTDRDALGFQFVLTTGKPRLRDSGYRIAADWLANLRAKGALPAGGNDDPGAALVEGRAVMAILSLDQLAKLPREGGVVPSRFGLAGVPGTREMYSEKRPAGVPPNYVPHFAGGRLGVVRSRCPRPEIAFDLLTDLGGPARGAELIATPGLGAGPTRTAHLDRERLLLWLGYGFDEERSRLLQDTLRHYAEQAVKNPTFGLRGPDRADLIRTADAPLRALGTGGVSAADRLKQIEEAWQALDAKVPNDTLRRWRLRAAGLN